ncbi:MAG TPA: hypothetical protein DEB09_03160 [Candidatus Magasanikbacteria bacterium]|nr:hypothetical protein [Candidatus Magasanikbacteria bacterium]
MKQTIGEWGEEQACSFLVRNNYKIICRNYRYKKTEIDIVAKDESGVLCFVEVKTRVCRTWEDQNKIDEITPEAEFDGSAERADNHKKQLLIKNTAILYCLENKIDIDNTRMKLEHISVYVRKDLKSANIKKFLLSVDRR